MTRSLFANRMVVFHCDLRAQAAAPANLPSTLKIDRVKALAELSERDLQEMTGFWNPKQAHRNIRERFAKGASLWLVRSADTFAGYGWSLRGATIEPYYVILAQEDVHLFDFHVFPQYRGQGVNPLLVNHILNTVSSECQGRAYIDAAEWNTQQLSSLRKTPFRRLGLAKSFGIFGRTFVSWSESTPASEPAAEAQGVPRKTEI